MEEVERSADDGSDRWTITLSMIKPHIAFRTAEYVGPFDREYKRFVIDAGSGEVLSMFIRELAGTV